MNFRTHHRLEEIKGRNLQLLLENKGKRHFWGEKGKNYGFYTTPEELENVRNCQNRKHKHFRNKSSLLTEQCIGYDDEKSDQQLHEQQFLRSRASGNKLKMNPQQNQIGFYVPFNQKEQTLIHQTENHHQKQSRCHLLSRNIDIKLPFIQRQKANKQPRKITFDLGLQKEQNEISRRKFESVQFQHKRSKTLGNDEIQQKLNKNQLIFYYEKRRDRKDNPTFCNSFAYPLPCYRYVK